MAYYCSYSFEWNTDKLLPVRIPPLPEVLLVLLCLVLEEFYVFYAEAEILLLLLL